MIVRNAAKFEALWARFLGGTRRIARTYTSEQLVIVRVTDLALYRLSRVLKVSEASLDSLWTKLRPSRNYAWTGSNERAWEITFSREQYDALVARLPKTMRDTVTFKGSDGTRYVANRLVWLDLQQCSYAGDQCRCGRHAQSNIKNPVCLCGKVMRLS